MMSGGARCGSPVQTIVDGAAKASAGNRSDGDVRNAVSVHLAENAKEIGGSFRQVATGRKRDVAPNITKADQDLSGAGRGGI